MAVARAARRAALKPYRKFSHGGSHAESHEGVSRDGSRQCVAIRAVLVLDSSCPRLGR